MSEPVYLRPPPAWEEHEKPILPGSPGMIYHPPWERACYAMVAVLVGITGSLGNALFTANLPTIQGQMGMTPSEAAWLSGAYVTLNMTANLLVYKFRQQFGMRLFAEIGLGLYAMLCVLHLVLGSPESLLWLRGASGLAAAACTSLCTLYMLQCLPRRFTLKTLVMGVGITQVATPLAWLLSPGLLQHAQWHNLYMLEAGLALLAFSAVVLLKLPSGIYIRVFEKRDFLSMALLIPGVGLLAAVLVQGTTRWWFDSPELAWMLCGAIVLLFTGLYLEHHRPNPLLQTRWFTQLATIRFVIGAILIRFLTTEQSYGMVGMMRTLGMTTDQMQPLFGVIFAGTLLGVVLTAFTFSIPKIGRQLLLATVLLGIATYLDFDRSSIDRPNDFMLSQFVLALGSGILMGPVMVAGLEQGIKFGTSHMLTAILTVSMTQTLGGLIGASILGTYQVHREQVYRSALTQQINPTLPAVVQRLQTQQQALTSNVSDPTLRAAQATAQLGQVVKREASVRAYNDVFRLVALVAFAYLAWCLLEMGHAKHAALRKARAARAAALTRNESRDLGTDAAEPDPDPGEVNAPPQPSPQVSKTTATTA